jgi:hypothetical protein
VVQTSFFNSTGDTVYSDDAPDATFAAVPPDTEPALVEQVVCLKKESK